MTARQKDRVTVEFYSRRFRNDGIPEKSRCAEETGQV